AALAVGLLPQVVAGEDQCLERGRQVQPGGARPHSGPRVLHRRVADRRRRRRDRGDDPAVHPALRPRGVQVRPVHQIAPDLPPRTPLRGGLSMTSLRRTLAACTLVLAAPALAPAQEVFRDISSQRLENILQGMNIQYKKGDAGKGTTYYD